MRMFIIAAALALIAAPVASANTLSWQGCRRTADDDVKVGAEPGHKATKPAI